MSFLFPSASWRSTSLTGLHQEGTVAAYPVPGRPISRFQQGFGCAPGNLVAASLSCPHSCCCQSCSPCRACFPFLRGFQSTTAALKPGPKISRARGPGPCQFAATPSGCPPGRCDAASRYPVLLHWRPKRRTHFVCCVCACVVDPKPSTLPARSCCPSQSTRDKLLPHLTTHCERIPYLTTQYILCQCLQ